MVDISGAYLNADMNTGLTVHMRLDKNMTGMMVKLSPQYEKYMDARGCVVVRLDKALYGCVESAALWYENLRESLHRTPSTHVSSINATRRECNALSLYTWTT